MKKLLIGLLTAIMIVCVGTAFGCSDDEVFPSVVVNGGFESADLSGWTVEYGDAYDDDSVTSRKTFSYTADVDPHGYVIPVNQTGNWYLSGKGFDNNRPSSSTGAIRSQNFILSGDGVISMKLAGGAQAMSRSDTAEQKPAAEVCFVGIYLASDDKMVACQTNRYFAEDASNIEINDYLNGTCYTDNFCQYSIDLSGYIGEEMYIRIVDNDTNYYYGYLSVDDIRIGKNAEAQKEGAYFTKSKANVTATAPSEYEICNGGFETGDLSGWETQGLAFSDEGVNSNPYWWAEQIPYEREGNFHYGYYNPSATGVMRSSVFTVGGSCYMTYKLGGCSDNNAAYLRFMEVTEDGKGKELFTASNFAYNNMQFPNIQNGLRTINMSQYRVNLTPFRGRKLYIEIVDNNSSPVMEGCVVLDSVNTYYKEVPQFTNCFDVEYEMTEDIPSSEYQVLNGGFEDGLNGWTYKVAEGSSDFGVVTEDKTWWGEKLPYNKSGKYHFSGLRYIYDDNGGIKDNESFESGRGTLTSSPFKVGGRGIMTFSLGGAPDPRFCYILLLNSDGVPVAKYGNTLFHIRGGDSLAFVNKGTNIYNMVSYRADLSKWYGQTLRIQLVDDAIQNFGMFTVDSFVTYYEDGDNARFPANSFEAINLLSENPQSVENFQVKNGSFETGDLSGWTMSANIGNVSYDYLWWDEWYTFNKSGMYFFSGFAGNEGEKGTLTSEPFAIGGTGIITFRLGGGRNKDLCYIEIIDADNPDIVYSRYGNEKFSTKGGIFTGVPITVGCEGFGANMILYKADLSRLLPKEEDEEYTRVRIRIVDNATEDWGLLFVDDFVTYYKDEADIPKNAVACINILPAPEIIAEEQKQPLNFAYFENGFIRLWATNANIDYEYTLSVEENAEFSLDGNVITITPFEGDLINGFEKLYEITVTVKFKNLLTNQETEITVPALFKAYFDNRQILNGDFESGDLTGWTVVKGEIKDSAISSDTTFWNEKITLNQGGNFHFDGTYAQDADRESETYAVRSKNFLLGGSGFISFKLGGRTAMLKVYKADGTLIAEYENTQFKNVNFPHIDEGCRLFTMTTFLADLSEYIGEELYIEICDGKEGTDFGLPMFDDIVTYYETAPVLDEMSDTVHLNELTSSTGEPCDYQLAWIEAENKLN